MDDPSHHLGVMEERRRELRARFASIFQFHKQFVWEIGCGHGHFLTAYAAKHPDRLCIGIDIATERWIGRFASGTAPNWSISTSSRLRPGSSLRHYLKIWS